MTYLEGRKLSEGAVEAWTVQEIGQETGQKIGQETGQETDQRTDQRTDQESEQMMVSAADGMVSEEKFSQFIRTVDEADYESHEPWYRWNIQIECAALGRINEKVRERYQVNPNKLEFPQNVIKK